MTALSRVGRTVLLLVIALGVMVGVAPSAPAHATETTSVAASGLRPMDPPDEEAETPDGGIVGDFLETACRGTLSPFLKGKDACKNLGQGGGKLINKKISGAWKAIKESLLGDILEAGRDLVGKLMKMVLTVALMGPTLDLNDTGLFGPGSMFGLMMWLGWCIAAIGLMWQLGALAVTGQLRYVGQILKGFCVNALLVGAGLTLINLFLHLGDLASAGLVDFAFDGQNDAAERMAAVMLPGIANPFGLLLVVGVVILVGAVQLILIFLREAAIPLQSMLLPVAGAGMMGGQATQKWAPRLVVSILTVITYKPLLALIICAGFTQFGNSSSFTEFLRGLATLVLGILAPGPLMKLFAPVGAEVGAGISSGGASGAVGAAANYASRRGGGQAGSSGGDGGGDGAPTNAVQQAQYREKVQAQSRGDGPGGGGGESPGNGSGEATAQAARSTAARADAVAGAAGGAAAGAAGAGAASGGSGAGAAGGSGSGGAVRTTPQPREGRGGQQGRGVTVLDGLDRAQGAADYIGDGRQEGDR